MTGTKKILEQMRKAPTNVRFADLQKVCEAHFGKPRQSGSSHAVYKTPWLGEAYQVRQVLLAIERLGA
ncbi:MAG: toxin HicA [Betaproteobacteria bacterium]|jgi:hypothetical protein|nr:toxin HicA [Betaproteobacteria bacterium]